MIDLERFTPDLAIAGGALIGLAASVALVAHGRVAGISGIVGGLLDARQDARTFRGWFLGGLVLAGVGLRLAAPSVFEHTATVGVAATIAAGLLVGFGTRLGSGCTSGHGVSGLSRLSPRSLVATAAFIATGMLVVLTARHLGGSAP